MRPLSIFYSLIITVYLLSDASAIGSKGKLSGKFSKIVNVIPMLSLLVGTITSYRKQSSFVFDTFFELCRKFNIQYSIATTQEKASTQSRKYQ